MLAKDLIEKVIAGDTEAQKFLAKNYGKLADKAKSGDIESAKMLAKFHHYRANENAEVHVGDKTTLDAIFAEDKSDPEMNKLAYKYYLMAADAGDAKSCTEVARRLYDGIGVEKNREKADEYYLRGAELGDVHAMHVVAFTATDDEKKFYWYHKAAELGERDSIKQIAIMLACGQGTEKNLEEAEKFLGKLTEEESAEAMYQISEKTNSIEWMERAAKVSTPAMIKVAENYVLKNDFENALYWYQCAADKNSADALSLIGDIYYIGEGNIEQNYKKAFEYYSKASKLGYNMATIKMALMLYKGYGEIEQNLPMAFELFKRICKTKENFFGVFRYNSVAKFFLSKMYANAEGTKKDFRQAFKWLKRAAAIEKMGSYESTHKVPEAMYLVAEHYFSEQEFEQAAEIYKKVVEYAGSYEYPYNLEAAKKLMWMYELGEGVPQDKEQAAQWRDKVQKFSQR